MKNTKWIALALTAVLTSSFPFSALAEQVSPRPFSPASQRILPPPTESDGMLLPPPEAESPASGVVTPRTGSDFTSSVYTGEEDFVVNGNRSQLTEAQAAAVDAVIGQFAANYIREGMSDFEKELMIIQYLIENVEYDMDVYLNSSAGGSDQTAYGALIEGKCVCAGYSDAFLQMAKAVGLTAYIVHSDVHAWNLVQLDGAWYHVDLTFEDPVGAAQHYGFGSLRNKYINLTDSTIRSFTGHESWNSGVPAANGTTYGPQAVAAYFS